MAFNRAVVGLTAFIACIGIGLAVTGAYFSGQQSHRSHKIAAYNKAVEEWTNIYRPQFLNTTFQIVPPNFAGISQFLHPLERVGGEVQIVPEPGEQINTYDGLLFVADLNPQEFAWSNGLVSNIPIRSTYSQTAALITQVNPVLMYEKVVGVSGNRTTEAMSHCARQGGWYDIDTSKCMLFYTANQYCAKVKMDVSQIWVVDNTNGDIGCTLSSPYSQTTWAPTGYTQTISTENRPATTTVSFHFLIRHAKDPLVVASELTNGSMDFGFSADSVQRVGMACVVLGILLVLPWVYVMVCGPRCEKNREKEERTGLISGQEKEEEVGQDSNA